MKSRSAKFIPVRLSLKDVLGNEYIEAVVAGRHFLSGGSNSIWKSAASEKVDFYPKEYQKRLQELLSHVGTLCNPGLQTSARGATTAEFQSHTKTEFAPVSGLGYYRVGENGHLFLTTKSEHYHVPLGHGFPGYQLLENARRLGIPNATHNNTRGHITRTLEEELVRTAAGLPSDDRIGLDRVLNSKSPTALNRVLNLETGSLAAEAAIKMALSRFYKPQADSPKPKYSGRIPVIVVIGDYDGGLLANYHGTTMVAQILRGMWPALIEVLEKHQWLLIRSVRPNDKNGLESVFAEYEQGRYKIAGFFHELVMMNYGATRLTEPFIRRMYSLCKKHDVPTVVDEIQSCVWSPQLFLYREYNIQPTFVVLGKGFPGGEYAASRLLFSSAMDTLPQFGALVTNGQEELASLAYLITLRWAEANAEVTGAVGEYYEERLKTLGAQYPDLIDRIEGRRHLEGIFFHNLQSGKVFVKQLNDFGLDISVQTYKDVCLPSALTKLPLIAGYDVIDLVLDRMNQALQYTRNSLISSV